MSQAMVEERLAKLRQTRSQITLITPSDEPFPAWAYWLKVTRPPLLSFMRLVFGVGLPFFLASCGSASRREPPPYPSP